MQEILPNFRYHPDPLKTGAIERSDTSCVCCGEVRGFIYTVSAYGTNDLRKELCPWCIADGSAAAKFEVSFNDDHPLLKNGIANSIATEVAERTPGYASWQQEEWLSHCNDACEFHGDASLSEVTHATVETKSALYSSYGLSEKLWVEITARYTPGGDPAIYKFVCRHCNQTLFGWDCT
jgi:uncharacterized protein CbrC (UPF0167 family)